MDTNLEKEIVFDRIVITGLAVVSDTAEIFFGDKFQKKVSISENESVKSIDIAHLMFENSMKIVFS